MLVYLALDLIVPLFVYLDEERSNKNCSYLDQHHFLYWIAALVLILTAGVRASTVGTDTGGYLTEAFTESHRVSFSFFYSYSRYMAWDPLFKIVMYFTSAPFPSLFVCQTTLSALTVIPVFIAIKNSSGSNRWLSAFVFTSLLYPMTFNLIRQSITMGLLLLAYTIANKRKYLPAILCVVLAIGFHRSAVIGLLAFPFLLTKSMSARTYMKIVLPIFAIILLVVIFARPVLTWATSTFGMYSSYLTGEAGGAPGARRSLLEICVFALVLTMSLAKHNAIRNLLHDDNVRNLATFCIIGILLYALCTLSIFLFRIGLYYLYYFILFAPCCQLLEPDSASKVVRVGSFSISYSALLIVLFCLAISIDYYGICLMNEVVPYVIL